MYYCKCKNIAFECVLSRLSRVQLFATPWTVTHQAPLSMEFSRKENWSGLPFPSPGDLPNPGIKSVSLMSPALADKFFTTKGFPGGSDGKMSACSVGDPGSIPGL